MVDVLRVTSVMTGLTGAPYYTTFHFEDLGTDVGATAAAAAVSDFWTELIPVINTGGTVNIDPDIAVIDMDTATQIGKFTISPPTTLAMSAGTDPLPWQTQGLIQWRTSAFVNGREVRGRTFVPGLQESGNTSGVPNSAIKGFLQDAADALWGQSPALMVASYANFTASTVTSANISSQWSFLRSRRD